MRQGKARLIRRWEEPGKAVVDRRCTTCVEWGILRAGDDCDGWSSGHGSNRA